MRRPTAERPYYSREEDTTPEQWEKTRQEMVQIFGGGWPLGFGITAEDALKTWIRLLELARSGAPLKRLDPVSPRYLEILETKLREAGLDRPASERAEIVARCVRTPVPPPFR